MYNYSDPLTYRDFRGKDFPRGAGPENGSRDLKILSDYHLLAKVVQLYHMNLSDAARPRV